MTDSNAASGLEPRLDYVTCASPAGVHRMAYREWGDPHNGKVLLCVHGLTRTGRDFDQLAHALAPHYRVVCPDVVGRGLSDWLIDSAHYVIPQYVSDMLTLIARLRPQRLDWVGTSMGGLIGMGLAGTLAYSAAFRPDRGGAGLPAELSLKLGKVVLNDIGPALNYQGLTRIGEYVGRPGEYASFQEAVDYVRSVSYGFGRHDQAAWEDMTRSVMLEQDGRWVKHYDLRIAEPFARQSEAELKASEALLWSAYESLPGPVLIVRGEQSDLLTPETLQEMLQRHPGARQHTVPQVGHAPTFRSEDEIAPVRRFLLEQD
ncbi:MAG: alpha/beta hydrolase [Alcaligenaceae bacterium]|nr:alpha/beta hydrolase [Alcaligenaceae bacterium]